MYKPSEIGVKFINETLTKTSLTTLIHIDMPSGDYANIRVLVKPDRQVDGNGRGRWARSTRQHGLGHPRVHDALRKRGHVRVNDDKVEGEGWHVRVLLMQQVVSGNRQPGSVLPCDVIHSFVFISLRRQPE